MTGTVRLSVVNRFSTPEKRMSGTFDELIASYLTPRVAGDMPCDM
jgi:hypothetical protein